MTAEFVKTMAHKAVAVIKDMGENQPYDVDINVSTERLIIGARYKGETVADFCRTGWRVEVDTSYGFVILSKSNVKIYLT